MKNYTPICPKNPYICKMRDVCEEFRNGTCPYAKYEGHKPYDNANVVVNIFKDFQEIIVYKKTFLVPNEATIKSDIDRTRLFKRLENGTLIPLKDDITIKRIQSSLFNSYKRSADSIYGYLLTNEWDYFFTLTFSPDQVNRNDDNAVKELWTRFAHNFTRRKAFKDVKILCVPERHEACEEYPRGALHFHCLFGNCNLDKYLTLARYPDNAFNRKLHRVYCPITNASGELIYNCSLWTYGFNTVCKIAKEDNQLKVVNYIAKYVNKQNKIGYGYKRYFHTRNLDFKEKYVLLMDTEMQKQLVKHNEIFKDNEKFTIYRVYGQN